MQEEKPIRGEGGYGYAHWTGGRRDHFEKWSEENNLDKSIRKSDIIFTSESGL